MTLAADCVAAKRLPSLISDSCLTTMAALAESTPPGCFVEVGVYKGGSLDVLYQLMQRQKDKGRTLFAFDSFSGMPVAMGIDPHQIGDFADCDMGSVQSACPDAKLIQGTFPYSLKIDLPPIAFVHADGDQYETTRDILQVLGPKMVPGGLMLFDDFVGPAGCIAAVNEFAPQREVLPDGRALVRF